MQSFFVKSASLANHLGETRGGEFAMGGYGEATKNLGKVEGSGFSSEPVMEELHYTNQAPVKHLGEATAGRLSLKLKLVNLLSKYLSMP